jgi:hypothetical protein
MASKTSGSLKGIFDPAKKAAAAAVMEPSAEAAAAPTGTMARNRKAGGRNIRVSGYIPPELEAALRDEVIRRTVAERKTVSLNDVLCDALTFWHQHGQAGQ